MGQVLVVVESPAKARTIKKYLGEGYSVKASIGHVRDLPKNELGIDIESGFKPKYINLRGKGKVIQELRKEMRKSTNVLLATDMDREGEAIAWHLKAILGNSGSDVKRIIFNEITKNALREAVSNPMDIDTNKVEAQQARRILDRLVGYLVSPVLWKIFFRGLSAGRVQSVGLRLICDREEEIRNFVPMEYWTIEGALANVRGSELPVRLFKIDGKKAELDNEGEANETLSAVKAGSPVVTDIRTKQKKRNPQPPFITSTLQREASNRLGFSAKRTMVIAQQLYEGIVLGSEGSVGLISYMRTDSTRVSDEAYQHGINYIEDNFGKDVAFGGKRGFRKTKLSQDAHEAIRPTDCSLTPDKLKQHLDKGQHSLYELIWKRFLASLAAPAIYEVTEVDISSGERYLLRANGRKLVKPGFLTIFPDKKSEIDTEIPSLSKGETLSIRSMEAIQHFTDPPARFSEASLIKELENKGIGRPSTYANILSIIQARDYVTKKKGVFYPTELGEIVWKTLYQLFRDIFEVDFTARMEGELDKVEGAEQNWEDVVRYFYEPLMVDLKNVEGKGKDLKKLVQEETDQTCEKCGSKLIKKWSRNGPFLACSKFPDCRYTRSLEEEEELDRKCPSCGGRLRYKNGRFGKFIACWNYPQCKYTEAITIGVPCPVDGCGGQVTEKRTRRGKIFYGCSNYPDCEYASWDKPTTIICPSCSKGYLVEKTTKAKGKFLKCPSCKHEEHV